eukprot:scaffold71943_cov64-Phaeocystis_antarctica.AAC.3
MGGSEGTWRAVEGPGPDSSCRRYGAGLAYWPPEGKGGVGTRKWWGWMGGVRAGQGGASRHRVAFLELEACLEGRLCSRRFVLAAVHAVEGQAGVGLVRQCHASIEVALRVHVGVGCRIDRVVGRVARGRVRCDIHRMALEVRL